MIIKICNFSQVNVTGHHIGFSFSFAITNDVVGRERF